MDLQNFVVTVWTLPHGTYGDIVEIDGGLVGDGLEWGAIQSSRDAPDDFHNRELDLERPHRKFKVTVEQLRELMRLCDEIEYSFREHPFTAQTGGTIFGVRMARGFQTVSVTWWGKFEDQIETIQNLHSAVYSLAEG